ncbi:hairy and enhancer of split related-7 [Thalassophryne amazonica]|uniref:hairy and enhancer of split related-7 n=1 Tax=Thalassophryne amazonica TaxID=390379 RepID=UPI0014716497|nr:hairy and enhancer of split related-7 [Thalassophryne amazonica]
MKMLRETEDATSDRKLIKSQVEKRRRERMNRSLERLRNMLIQEAQILGGTQHRVEKAEILEHTVLFLQDTARRDQTRAAGGGHKPPFQDGFSTCLQRAAQFLGPDGKGLWLRAALNATFAARFARPDPDPGVIQWSAEAHSSTALLHVKSSQSILQLLRLKTQRRLHARTLSVNNVPYPVQLPVPQGVPKLPQSPQRQDHLETSVERRATKQNQSQSPSVSQTLWRPWP